METWSIKTQPVARLLWLKICQILHSCYLEDLYNSGIFQHLVIILQGCL